MTRIPFDQLSKQLLEEFLGSLGRIERSLEVPGESRFVDLWFVPYSQTIATPLDLGLLGRIATTPCLIEPFRNQPSPTEVRSCLEKLFAVQSNLQRQARREKIRLDAVELPRLWILSPSASQRLVNGFHLQPDLDQWESGCYFWGEFEPAAIVAIDQLPVNPTTLWLRLLGKGTTQRRAIEEVVALSAEESLRSIALKVLANWRIIIESSPDRDEEDRELIMALSQAYLEWEQATERRGIQQGQRLVVENLLRSRFGELDRSLLATIPALLELPVTEYTPLLLQLSYEELIARFHPKETDESSGGQTT